MALLNLRHGPQTPPELSDYTVDAINSAGTSASSAAVPGTTLLNIPAGLSLSGISDTGITVRWNTVTGATSYELYRNDVSIDANAVSPKTEAGLSPGTSYTYEVRALNAVSASNRSIAETTITVPSTPANLTVGSPTETTLSISWDASTGADAYELYRDASPVPIYMGPGLSFTDTGLTSSTAYNYQILAKNPSGASPKTTAVPGTTSAQASAAPAAAPAGLAVSSQTNTTLTLNWNATADATSYELYRGGTLVFTDTAQVRTFTDVGLSGGTEYNYTVAASNSQGQGPTSGVEASFTTPNAPTGLAVSNPTGNGLTLDWNISTGATGYQLFRGATSIFTGAAITFADTGLATGTPYNYSVLATNTSGAGPQSATVTGTTTPATPGNLTVTAISETSVTLTWNTEVGATSYQLMRDGTQIHTGFDPIFTDSGRTSATAYNYTVKSTNASGSSPVSAVTVGTTSAAAASPPAAPTGLNVGGATVATLDISWNAVADATSYQLFRDGTSIYTGTALTFMDSGLAAATTYTYNVSASNSAGTGSNSGPAQGTTVPTTPGGLAVSGATETTLTISWSASTGAASYELFRDGALVYTDTTPSLSYTNAGLSGGATYSYQVQATSASGTSPKSSAASGKTVPSYPGGLAVVGPTETTLDIMWNSTAGSASYELYRDSALIFTDTTNALNFTDTGLTASSTYTYQVLARNSSGAKALAGAPSVQGTTGAQAVTVPAVPSGLAVSGETETSINVTWGSVAGATRYELFRGGTKIFTDTTAALAYSDTFLSGGTLYNYTVLAANSAGPSAQSAVVVGKTVPSPPTGVAVSGATASSLNISWAASNGADSYVLYRNGAIIDTNATSPKTDSGLAGGTSYEYELAAVNASGESGRSIAAFGLTIPSAPILAVTNPTETSLTVTWVSSTGAASYNLYKDSSAGGAFTNLVLSGIEGTTYTDAGLTVSTEYFYKAKAWNSAGYSPLSATPASGTTQAAAATAPATPVGLRVVESFDDAITMAWNPSVSATSYELFRNDGSTNVQVYSGIDLTFHDSGLKSGKSFNYTVQATNSQGSNPVSAPVTALTLPDVPSGLAFGTPTVSSLPISWNAVTGATGYQLTRSDNPSGPYANIYAGPTASFTDTGLVSGGTYYYKVSATNAGGASAQSGYAVETTTPTLTVPGAPSVGGPTVSTLDVTWASTGAGAYFAYRDTNRFGDFAAQVYNGPATAFTDTGLAGGTTYYYKIKASAAGSVSGFSAHGSGTTLAPIPPTPSGLTVSGATVSSLYISWNASSGATGYYLHRDGSPVSGYNNAATHHTDSGLDPSTSYTYEVKAYNSSGESVMSAGMGGTTSSAILSPPATVNAGNPTLTTVDVSWSAVAGATSYKLYHDREGDGYTFAAEIAAPTVALTDTGLFTATDYKYIVRATNAAGDSPYSTPSTVVKPSGQDRRDSSEWITGRTPPCGSAGILPSMHRSISSIEQQAPPGPPAPSPRWLRLRIPHIRMLT